MLLEELAEFVTLLEEVTELFDAVVFAADVVAAVVAEVVVTEKLVWVKTGTKL